MITELPGKRLIACIAASALLLTGCFFNLGEEKDFKSWYFGKPGMGGALGEEGCDPYADHIEGERHPYYLHFRTPEVFYQPQGGGRYPERSTATALDDQSGSPSYACEVVQQDRETFNFKAVDAGLVDVMLPLRQKAVPSEERVGAPETGSYARSVAHNAGIAAVLKGPVYFVHDVLKTLYIPVAGAYFMIRSDDRPVEEAAVAGAPLVQAAGQSQLPQAPRSAESPEAAVTAGGLSDIAAGEQIPDAAMDQAAAASPPITANGADRPIREENLTTGTHPSGPAGNASAKKAEASPAAVPDGSAVLQEEVPTDRPGHAQAGAETLERPQDEVRELASVSETRQARSDSPTPPSRLEEIIVSQNDLVKQVAFLGFLGQTASADPAIKAFFEQIVWSAMLDECDRGVRMLRPGESRFPEAMSRLSRDQFGRLNSFELTTLARFSGINAVVTGSLIDIGVANEISGLLWYKRPQGTLRASVLVEVYDAETGTKLLDRTLVREMEVAELEPGREGRLREEDRVPLQAALGSIAAEMSEIVCEVLAKQPWRGFVTGIDGTRITLSAGAGTGLAPGHILAVHNSQIIEGLNHQQYFLTGERVGRLQIVSVQPDRAEARLIEGADLKDYSTALPER